MTETVQPLLRYPFARVDPLQPPPEYAELRGSRPVCRVTLWDGSWAWLVTRHADVKRVLGNDSFSADGSDPALPHPSPAAAAAKKGQRFFSRMDPPEHHIHRRMLSADFALREISKLRPEIEGLVSGLLDDMSGRGGAVDLVKTLAEPIPSVVTCRLLGLPESDAAFFSDRLGASLDYSRTPEQVQAAAGDLVGYFETLVRERSKDPGDDLVGRMITTQVREKLLGPDELVRILWLLLIAGFDTTINVITLGTLLLIKNPEQAADLRENPEEVTPTAVEELLRFTSVTHNVAVRLATEDLELSGQLIKAGEGVIAPVAAANRDPEVFPDPDRLDLRRNARPHLAFGFGTHQCLGKALARLELAVVFPQLVRRFPTLSLACDERDLVFKKDAMIYGAAALPVTW